MKTASAGLKAHLAGEVTTICTCWKIIRRDNVELHFTDLDDDLVVGGDTYKSAVGYTRTALDANADMQIDNVDVTGIFDDASITEDDLRSGLYDGADVYVFLVNWANVSQGTMALRRGTIGEVVMLPSGVFHSTMYGLAEKLQQTVGEIYTPSCRADLGDAKCGIDLDAGGWRKPGTVTSVIDDRVFSCSITEPRAVDDWFRYGVVEWQTGDNSGRFMDVRGWVQSTNTVTLFLGMPQPIQVGDTFAIYPGCDKTLAQCRDRFDNIVNFRGEPYVPGTDMLLKSPATA